MRVTLRQIAERCDVSIQTVSRVLRGHGEAYRKATVERVLTAARELDYRPRRPMPTLVTAEAGDAAPATRHLGLITPHITSRPVALCLEAIQAAGREHDFETLTHVLLKAAPDDAAMSRAIHTLFDRGVEGLVVYRGRPISQALRRALCDLALPTVFVDWGPPRWQARVRFHREPGIDAAVAHLAAWGHRRVLMMASQWGMDFPEHKVLPYQRACARHGLELSVRPQWMHEPGAAAEASVYAMVGEVLEHWDEHRATALLMEDDNVAVAALAALRDAGVPVPEQMSVVGFSDMPSGRFSSPPLTTVAGPAPAEVGRATLDILTRLIDEPNDPPEPVTLPFQLVARQSTGPAPDAAEAIHAPRHGDLPRQP